MKEEFRKEIVFYPAYDLRKDGFAVHGVDLEMSLHGSYGAVQFKLATNWHLPHIQEEFGLREPYAIDLGYHSYKPVHDGQSQMGECKLLNNEECYYDGSSLNARRIYDVLVAEGSEGVWRELEGYYKEVFENEKQ